MLTVAKWPSDKVWVFLGPSLPIVQAKALLPDAIFHPPIKQGDLLPILPYQPRAVVIIDGEFGQTASVQHKEILQLLQKQIPIYGASSMGALRAAELARYGMIGVGGVYRALARQVIDRDDEVALTHLAAEHDFKPISHALVTVRSVLAAAYRQSIISQAAYRYLLASAKKQFYPKRHLKLLVDSALQRFPSHRGLQQFAEQWSTLMKHDCKRNDAIALLTLLAREQQQLRRRHDLVANSIYFQQQRLRAHRESQVQLEWIAEHLKLTTPSPSEADTGQLNEFLITLGVAKPLLSRVGELLLSLEKRLTAKGVLPGKAFCQQFSAEKLSRRQQMWLFIYQFVIVRGNLHLAQT